MWRFVVVAMLCSACGRIGFDLTTDAIDDARESDAPPSDSASSFAYAFPDQCPSPEPTADPIVWALTTTRLSGGEVAPGATVSVARTFDGVPVVTATTDMNAVATLSIPTGGAAFPTYITVGGSGYVTGVGYATRAFHVSEPQNFNVGTPADVAATYAARGLAQAASTATIFVGILRCDNAYVPGVTIASTPTATVIYAGDDGTPEPARTTTSLVSYAALLDVPFGRVTLVTSGTATPIAPLEIEVSAAHPLVYVNLFTNSVSL